MLACYMLRLFASPCCSSYCMGRENALFMCVLVVQCLKGSVYCFRRSIYTCIFWVHSYIAYPGSIFTAMARNQYISWKTLTFSNISIDLHIICLFLATSRQIAYNMISFTDIPIDSNIIRFLYRPERRNVRTNTIIILPSSFLWWNWFEH